MKQNKKHLNSTTTYVSKAFMCLPKIKQGQQEVCINFQRAVVMVDGFADISLTAYDSNACSFVNKGFDDIQKQLIAVKVATKCQAALASQ